MAALTEYEAYSLDVSGYIVLRAVLTAAELHALRNEADALAALGRSAPPTLLLHGLPDCHSICNLTRKFG